MTNVMCMVVSVHSLYRAHPCIHNPPTLWEPLIPDRHRLLVCHGPLFYSKNCWILSQNGLRLGSCVFHTREQVRESARLPKASSSRRYQLHIASPWPSMSSQQCWRVHTHAASRNRQRGDGHSTSGDRPCFGEAHRQANKRID